MKTYIFHAELSGQGNDPDEAWEDAVSALALEAGEPPSFTIDEDDEDDEDDDGWETRLDEAQKRLDARQAAGEIIQCSVAI